MINFLKKRFGGIKGREAEELGPLEASVMAALWQHGESSVHDVMKLLNRPLAYTTVMTTLDRLFKKQLLLRRRCERAYLYSARLSKAEWERRGAEHVLAKYLAGPEESRELLVSTFLDALGQHDRALLDELERKIHSKRKELAQRGRK